MTPFFIYTAVILSLPFFASSSKTTVILVDNNKTLSAVDVKTDAGKVTLDESYTVTSVSKAASQPEPVTKIDEATVHQKYKILFDALPHKPVSMLFYFEEGTSQLVPESMSQIPALIELIQSEEPCIVDIIGHSDTKGTVENNYELGLKRAEALKTFLENNQVSMKQLTLQSYGENDLLIPTEDEVSEPKNRRVEVRVR